MEWLDGRSCEAAATLGWAVGGLAGAIIDVGILGAIIWAPRLREHGGVPRGPRVFGRWAPILPAIAAIILWSWGLAQMNLATRPCYGPASALATAIVIALPMLVLFPLAAIQIARRSVW
jgi:hypothetical protein